MRDTITYCGAHRLHYSCDDGVVDWAMCDDKAYLRSLANRGTEVIRGVSSLVELYRRLEERYPGRCRITADGCSVYPYPVVADDDFAVRIVAAAAKHGTVWVCSEEIPDAVWGSCVRGNGRHAVVYDPVKARKRKARKRKARASQG